MKKLVIILIALFSFFVSNAQNNPFEKVMEMKGVDVVYISKAMLGMASSMGSLEHSMMDMSSVVSKLNSITIIESEEEGAFGLLRKEVNNILSKGGYERAMFMKEDDSKTVFYTKMNKNSPNNEILMVVEEDNSEITVIRIEGNLSMEDLQKMTQ